MAQLASLGGQLLLDPSTNHLALPGQQLGVNPSADLTLLHDTLDQLRQLATPLIWPLQDGFDSGSGTSSVAGFVAARVVSVDPIVAGQPLTFRLQPTLVSTAAAVTDFTRRGVGGVPLINPYVCKVRFVE